jgi:hypothetical protein
LLVSEVGSTQTPLQQLPLLAVVGVGQLAPSAAFVHDVPLVPGTHVWQS